jgi:hypothetical protein
MEQLTPAKLDSMITETTTELLYAQRALISPSRADAMEKASQLLSILLELKELRNKSPQKIILPPLHVALQIIVILHIPETKLLQYLILLDIKLLKRKINAPDKNRKYILCQC